MRDIMGHILGFFFFLVVMYYSYAFALNFSKGGSRIVEPDLGNESGYVLSYMMLLVWLLAAAATIIYYMLFRASWTATMLLAVAAASVLYLIVQTNILNGNLQLALFVWSGLVAAFVHHIAVAVIRLFVGDPERRAR